MSVGIATLDSDHKTLIALIDLLDKPERVSPGKLLAALARYCDVHFAREEKAFATVPYPSAEAHRNGHARMTSWIAEQAKKTETDPASLDLGKLRTYLIDWLYTHILKEDMGYKEYVLEERKRIETLLAELPGIPSDLTELTTPSPSA
jgi:hemerythrin-like metal-binding protein